MLPFRNLDILLLSTLNGCQRTEEDFRRIFHDADERFVFEGALKVGVMGVMRASWKSSV